MKNETALDTYLQPIIVYLEKGTVNELIINKPYELWVEEKGMFEKHTVNDLSFDFLLKLVDLIAESNKQNISNVTPLLSGILPGGYRVQCVIPSACPEDQIIIVIRRQNHINKTLDYYKTSGAFDCINQSTSNVSPTHEKLKALYLCNEFDKFIKYGIESKITFMISGGASTGKTTFLNACLLHIPHGERLVTLEDAREIMTTQENVSHLLYSRGDQGISTASAKQLLEASLRLRPDRIILGELRGAEAYSYLRAINTGHEGSICTLHADSPLLAYEQLAFMVMESGIGLKHDEIMRYIKSIIPIIIQFKRKENGERYISEIYYDRIG